MVTSGTEVFRAARDFLLANRTDYRTAYQEFRWPALTEFNWALDWFDVIARDNDRPALWIVEADGSEQRWSFAELSRRSNQVANWLRRNGVQPGDRLILMLGNQVELWETILAAMKLRAVIIPATPLLGPADLADRFARGQARHVVVGWADTGKFADLTGDPKFTRIAVGGPAGWNGQTNGGQPAETDRQEGRHEAGGDGPAGGWLSFQEAYGESPRFTPDGPTRADDPLLLYFTSGTTARPKLVEHTNASYPVGHLSTMFWIGLEPGDVHLNISSPGWAKHAWSSVFAPWNAEATVYVYNYTRFDAAGLLAEMQRCGVTSFCAPPTVWRMLIQSDLSRLETPPRKVVGAGEPLNPEVIEQVRSAWGITIRDGFGQTESTAQVGNPPGEPVRPGSMGRPLPGYTVTLVDPVTGVAGDDGEICLDLSHRPLGLMVGYRGETGDLTSGSTEDGGAAGSTGGGAGAPTGHRGEGGPAGGGESTGTQGAMAGGYYHTGDIGSRDADGYLTYVGRTDDVFKSSDYRISPFELESVLLEHDAVAEAAVVPSPDPVRLTVPKAYVVLAAGWQPGGQTAAEIFAHCRRHLAPYQRIRRLEFADLPKTISGKIRRTELRERERVKYADPAAHPAGEYREEDTK